MNIKIVSPKMRKYLKNNRYNEPHNLKENQSGFKKTFGEKIYILGDSNTRTHKEWWIEWVKANFPKDQLVFLPRGGEKMPKILQQLQRINPEETKMIIIGSLGGNDARKLAKNPKTRRNVSNELKSTGAYYKEVIDPLINELKDLQEDGIEIMFFGLPYGKTKNKFEEPARAAVDRALKIATSEANIKYISVYDMTQKIKGSRQGRHYSGRYREAYRKHLANLVGGKKASAKAQGSAVGGALQADHPHGKIIGKLGKHLVVDSRMHPDQKVRQKSKIVNTKRSDRSGNPTLIVIHKGTSGSPTKTISTWASANRTDGASSNFEVARDGTIYVIIPPQFSSQHAGYTAINRNSIGIDLEHGGGKLAGTPAQIDATRLLVNMLSNKYGISRTVAPGNVRYSRQLAKALEEQGKTLDNKKFGEVLYNHFMNLGIGIIRHRNVSYSKSCPQDFPVERLGTPYEFPAITSPSPDVRTPAKSPAPEEKGKKQKPEDPFGAGAETVRDARDKNKPKDPFSGGAEIVGDEDESDDPFLDEKKKRDPKKGTGKKPKGSSRRLYTDENPKDTVRVKFSTVQDIRDTLSKASFKSKSHKRQSQIINLIHQRVRAAYRNAKDPKVKKRLKKAYDYATKRKEASKRKTKRLRKEQNEPFQKAVKKNYRKMKIRLIGKGGSNYVSAGMKKPSYARSKSAPPGFGGSLEEAAPQK